MKKIALILSVILLSTSYTSYADIQSPPGNYDNRTRKLSRGLGNLLYGITELPSYWRRTVEREGSTAAASWGLVNGAKRSVVRMGFGLYEVVTFPFPTYKDSFRNPLPIKEKWDAHHGYHDFPRELGFQSAHDYVRSTAY